MIALLLSLLLWFVRPLEFLCFIYLNRSFVMFLFCVCVTKMHLFIQFHATENRVNYLVEYFGHWSVDNEHSICYTSDKGLQTSRKKNNNKLAWINRTFLQCDDEWPKLLAIWNVKTAIMNFWFSKFSNHTSRHICPFERKIQFSSGIANGQQQQTVSLTTIIVHIVQYCIMEKDYRRN